MVAPGANDVPLLPDVEAVPVYSRASLSVLFFISGHFRCGASVEHGLPETLISFILSENWLKNRTKQSTGEDIASLLSLQNPTVVLVEEQDGVLFESRLMRTCSWSASHPIWC